MDAYAAALGFGGPAPADPYAAALGFTGKSKKKAAEVDVPSPDVAGGTFLQQSTATQAAIAADVRRTGAQSPTVNGQPIDSMAVAPPVVAPIAARGPTDANGIPVAPGANTTPTAAPDVPWWQKGYAGFQAGANALTGATSGAIGGLVAGGNTAVQQILHGVTGTPLPANLAGPNAVQDAAGRGAAALTYQPSTQTGQDYAEAIAKNKLVQSLPAIAAVAPTLPVNARPALNYTANKMGAVADRSMDGMRASFEAKKAAARVEPTMDAAPAQASPGQVQPQAASPAGTPAQANVPLLSLKFEDAPQGAPSGSVLSRAEQERRAAVLSSVGLTSARRSALTGDGLAAASDAQTAKLDSPSGNAMKAQLDAERTALSNHADSLVRSTGGTQGLDQSALFGRGNSIVAPLDALKEHYDTKTRGLYATAAERAQGVPTDLGGFRTVLGDDAQLTNADRVHLRSAVNAYAKSLGMTGEDGTVFSNAQQAETMRQYLKENWSPQNAGYTKKLTQALDEDVFKSAGEDVYGEARKMWAERKNTLDNPNGIAKIMDASGPEGVNRSVPIEKIPDAIAGMPVAQFSHIVDTLKNAPAEIQPQSAAALSEIKSHFANKVQAIGTSQAGQWNAKGVTKFLNNNSERLAQVFTPDEIAQFKNLNDAGHILAKDQSYPGAAVQQHNLVRAGAAAALQTGGAAVGGALFGPAGSAAGSWLGSRAGSSLSEGASLRAVQKRMVPLRSIQPSEAGK